MKKGLKALLMMIAALMITIGGFRLLFSSADTTEYKIFAVYSEGYFLHKILGIVPKTYKNGFEIKTIERYDNTEVLYVVDKNGSSHPNFIVLKKDSEIEILKGYPSMFKKVSETEFDFKKHVSESINLEVFNSYIAKHKMSKQEVIRKYCFSLSREELHGSFLLIGNRQDIDSLIEKNDSKINYLKTFPETYNLITPENIKFNEIDPNTAYCWFINKGVVQFNFDFGENNIVEDVNSEIIGFLGIEAPMM